MAGANLPAKKYKKTSPTVTRLSFECSGNQTRFIDIGLGLSAINRKFYRAGVYYYVNSIEVYNNSTGVVDIHTIPDTWVTKNAWNRGFQLFQKMNAMVDPPISNIGRPKYHDFKVYMSDLHRTTGSLSPSLHGINGAHAIHSPDEWAYSRFVSADDDGDAVQQADDFYVHMVGPHNGNAQNWQSVSLIKSYAESRQFPVDDGLPVIDLGNEAQSDPLMNIFDFSSEEQMNDIVANLESDNDQTPYNAGFYVGESANAMQHVARIGTEVGVGRVGRASGFCAPLGLICVDPSGLPPEDNFRIVLNLAVGTYHGVYAERA
jgi:hypothetical protein